MPRWVHLMIAFWYRAIIPNIVVETLMPLFVFSIYHDRGDGYVILIPFYPMVTLSVFNFYLFACVTPGVNKFFCFHLTHKAKPTVVPWKLVRYLCHSGYSS